MKSLIIAHIIILVIAGWSLGNNFADIQASRNAATQMAIDSI